MYIFRIQWYLLLSMFVLCLTVLGACNSTPTSPSGSTSATNVTSTQPAHTVVATVEVVTVTSTGNTPGAGPIIILSPTPVSGGGSTSQQAILADRTLVINSVSKGSGSDANSTAITLSLTVKNTGKQTITNKPVYYSLFGAEGDVFGLAPNTTGSFFNSINAGSSLSGSVVFQVPTGATTSLRLFYRPDTANEAVFLPLTV